MSDKKDIRRSLINAAIATLERDGWKIGRAKAGVRGRVRSIAKDGKTWLAAIRTSQDHWIAFPRNAKDTKWVTLSDVDVVVAAAVDDPVDPKFAQVHFFEAKELEERFDRAYKARKQAGHALQRGRGVWVSLYHEDSTNPVYDVGAGIGRAHPPIALVPLGDPPAAGGNSQGEAAPTDKGPKRDTAGPAASDESEPLTIAQAKARLARALGVSPENIKITVEA